MKSNLVKNGEMAENTQVTTPYKCQEGSPLLLFESDAKQQEPMSLSESDVRERKHGTHLTFQRQEMAHATDMLKYHRNHKLKLWASCPYTV